MGVYRAALNLPILRFGKEALLDDADPNVLRWVAAGALVRLDDLGVPLPPPLPPSTPKPAPAPPAPTQPAEVLQESELVAPPEDEPIKEEAPAKDEPVIVPLSALQGKGVNKPSKPKYAPAAPVADGSDSVNPDLGIKFD